MIWVTTAHVGGNFAIWKSSPKATLCETGTGMANANGEIRVNPGQVSFLFEIDDRRFTACGNEPTAAIFHGNVPFPKAVAGSEEGIA